MGIGGGGGGGGGGGTGGTGLQSTAQADFSQNALNTGIPGGDPTNPDFVSNAGSVAGAGSPAAMVGGQNDPVNQAQYQGLYASTVNPAQSPTGQQSGGGNPYAQIGEQIGKFLFGGSAQAATPSRPGAPAGADAGGNAGWFPSQRAAAASPGYTPGFPGYGGGTGPDVATQADPLKGQTLTATPQRPQPAPAAPAAPAPTAAQPPARREEQTTWRIPEETTTTPTPTEANTPLPRPRPAEAPQPEPPAQAPAEQPPPAATPTPAPAPELTAKTLLGTDPAWAGVRSYDTISPQSATAPGNKTPAVSTQQSSPLQKLLQGDFSGFMRDILGQNGVPADRNFAGLGTPAAQVSQNFRALEGQPTTYATPPTIPPNLQAVAARYMNPAGGANTEMGEAGVIPRPFLQQGVPPMAGVTAAGYQLQNPPELAPAGAQTIPGAQTPGKLSDQPARGGAAIAQPLQLGQPNQTPEQTEQLYQAWLKQYGYKDSPQVRTRFNIENGTFRKLPRSQAPGGAVWTNERGERIPAPGQRQSQLIIDPIGPTPGPPPTQTPRGVPYGWPGGSQAPGTVPVPPGGAGATPNAPPPPPTQPYIPGGMNNPRLSEAATPAASIQPRGEIMGHRTSPYPEGAPGWRYPRGQRDPGHVPYDKPPVPDNRQLRRGMPRPDESQKPYQIPTPYKEQGPKPRDVQNMMRLLQRSPGLLAMLRQQMMQNGA